MFDTILVPIDLAHKDNADRQIASARLMANEKSRIIILNVLEVLPEYAMSYVPGDALIDIGKEINTMLAGIKKKFGDDLEIFAEQGHPGNMILEVATREKADAIIIASHKPGLSDYFIGSTAARVVRHAKCSVLVLR